MFRERLREMGIDPDVPLHNWSFNREIDRVLGRVTPGLRRRVSGLLRDLGELDKEIRAIDATPAEGAA